MAPHRVSFDLNALLKEADGFIAAQQRASLSSFERILHRLPFFRRRRADHLQELLEAKEFLLYCDRRIFILIDMYLTQRKGVAGGAEGSPIRAKKMFKKMFLSDLYADKVTTFYTSRTAGFFAQCAEPLRQSTFPAMGLPDVPRSDLSRDSLNLPNVPPHDPSLD
uniref:Uncharacterized protein n=1 Tax=Plectus sambesii TaxID=2011161 RepID=A0A914UVP5_9BILA